VNRLSLRALLAAAFVASAAACAQTNTQPSINAGPYVPTPTVIVNELLRLAEPKPGEVLVDLGSGDGRLVTTAAKQFGTRGFGVEIQAELVELATQNAKREGVGDRVRFIRQDLFTTDVSEANIITLYLLPSTVVKLVPKFLAELKPGTRIISHDYPLAPWEHERVEEFSFEEKIRISGTTRTVLFRYIIPARIAGTWELTPPAAVGKAGRIAFTQDPTLRVRGIADIDGRSVALEDVKLRGTDLSFTLPAGGALKQKVAFRGRIDGRAAEGSAEVPGGAQGWKATLR
jgi:protein-L-isoaspartate O-methyltransferase